MKKLFVILTLSTLSACSLLEPVDQPRVFFTVPAKPILPIIQESELECLSPETYAKIATRDLKRKRYSEELESVLEAINK